MEDASERPGDAGLMQVSKFKPGQSGNPKGRPRGALATKTKLQSLLTPAMADDAQSVLKSVLRKAKNGSLEHEELVLRTIVAPFLKAQASKDGGVTKDRRPVVNINISESSGLKDVKGAVIDQH